MKKPVDDNRRGKTDTSLTGERSKTDHYIDTKSEKVNKVINDKIGQNRIKSDTDKKSARAAIDKRKIASRNDLSTSPKEKLVLEDQEVIKELQRVDAAHATERKNEDSLRMSEQDQKESITESILKKERSETDLNLLDERKEVDKESKRSQDTLTEQTGIANASKSDLAMRDQFLAVVSHDLKNPLSSISMATQIMKDNLKSGDMSDQEAMIEVIDRNAKVMNRMITDLLDVERMTNGKLELNLTEINVCDLLTECKIILDPLVKSKGLTLVVDLCEEKLMVKADHDKILQVLSNLVGNSLKFTAPGGEIKISFQKDPLKISVTDTGSGISKENQLLLFKKFSQLESNDRSGLGLGLFICKWIIEAHNGTISVVSEPNKGSTFSFTL